MISFDEAQAAVLGRVPVLPTEKVPLGIALSRILRAPVAADRDLPPFNRAAMDGFAVRSADLMAPRVLLQIVGEVRAGVWPDLAVESGEAIRIMTGSVVPEGADAVIQVERTTLVEEGGHGMPRVLVETSVTAGQNIVPRGSEAAAGQALIQEGVRIGAAHLAVLASVGATEPLVSMRPRVAVLVTGDEVIDPKIRPSAAKIRNANGPALLAAIEDAGGLPKDFGIVPDDRAKTRAVIERALSEGHEAIVLSGGVSMGDFDFVEDVLIQLGVSLHVTAVRMKPGAPFVFGTREGTLVFGLPGNPVSAQVTFELLVRPALLKMQGASAFLRPLFPATLEGPLTNRSNRRNYLPVTTWRGAQGLIARPLSTQGSGDIVAHAFANALAILEPDRTSALSGDDVLLYPLSSFLEV